MISLLVTLVIIGVALYLVNTVIPMVNWMKTVINCIVALAVILYLLHVFGIYSSPIRLRG